MQKGAEVEEEGGGSGRGGGGRRKEEGKVAVVDMDRDSTGTEPFAVPTPMREPKPAKRSRKQCCLWCCGITTGVVLLVVVILIILAFTVFKPKDPKLTVDSVALSSFNLQLGDIFTNLNPRVDISLDTKVTVKNPNYASFKYKNTTAYIFYHGKEIGDSSIAAGKVGSRSSVQLDVPVTVRITGNLINSNLTTDIASGIFPVATQVEIKGTANFLNIVKLKNARSTSYCELEIILVNQTLKDYKCDSKFKV